MSVAIHPGRLRYEMARRGWSAAHLARECKLSGATISAALAGRPISATSLALIGEALVRVPPVEAIESLILGDRGDLGLQ